MWKRKYILHHCITYISFTTMNFNFHITFFICIFEILITYLYILIHIFSVIFPFESIKYVSCLQRKLITLMWIYGNSQYSFEMAISSVKIWRILEFLRYFTLNMFARVFKITYLVSLVRRTKACHYHERYTYSLFCTYFISIRKIFTNSHTYLYWMKSSQVQSAFVRQDF